MTVAGALRRGEAGSPVLGGGAHVVGDELSDYVVLVDLNLALLATRTVRVGADDVGELSLAAPCMRLLRQGRFYAVSGAWEIAVMGLGLPLKPVRMGIGGADKSAGRQCTAWRDVVLAFAVTDVWRRVAVSLVCGRHITPVEGWVE